jgi:SAM-dependent methyltransferase
MILGNAFHPTPGTSRMLDNADVVAAHQAYRDKPSRNLTRLLRGRYEWCNQFVGPNDEGVELAAGIGAARDHIRCRSLLLTDIEGGDWLDMTGVDATDTPFEDGSFDFVLVSNAIHHLAHPIRLFDEVARILRPGGYLLVRDVKCSLLQRVAARLTRVEGYDFDVDVYDHDAVLSDPANAWSANNAVPDLLFDDVAEFERRVPAFHVVHHRYDECLLFLNSGGVTHKTLSIPLPEAGLGLLASIDRVLTRLAPAIFALQRSVALRATSHPASRT